MYTDRWCVGDHEVTCMPTYLPQTDSTTLALYYHNTSFTVVATLTLYMYTCLSMMYKYLLISIHYHDI